MFRKEDTQLLAHPHPDRHKFCSGKGQREDKRNLKFRDRQEGDEGERGGGKGIMLCLVAQTWDPIYTQG